MKSQISNLKSQKPNVKSQNLTGDEEERQAEEINNLKSQLARSLADYDNLRKRTEVEKEIWYKFAAERILTRLLPVLDNLESALEHLKDQGLAIAIGEFKKILNEENLVEITPKVGDNFDHDLHEVIETVPGGGVGKIAELILPGWKFADGPVVRYAKVKVYGEPVENNQKVVNN